MRSVALMPRRRRRTTAPIPDTRYRDTAIVYGVMAVSSCSWRLTGGDRACGRSVAAAFFVVIATAWSWWSAPREDHVRGGGGRCCRRAAGRATERNGGRGGQG